MKDRILFMLTKYGSRRSKRQKKKFKSYIKNYASNINKDVSIQPYKIDRIIVENIIIGELNTSKYIFVAPYDTGEKMLNSQHKRYINQFELNRQMILKNRLIYILIGFFISFVSLYLIYTSFSQKNWLRIIMLMFGVISLIIGVITSRGYSSKYNVSQTIPVTFLLDMLEKMDGSYAVVLLDNTETLDLGLATLLENNDLKNKYIIRIGNMGYGSQFVALTTIKNSLLEKLKKNLSLLEIEMITNNFLQQNCKEYIHLNWCEKDEQGYYIPYYATPKDHMIHSENIEEMFKVVNLIQQKI